MSSLSHILLIFLFAVVILSHNANADAEADVESASAGVGETAVENADDDSPHSELDSVTISSTVISEEEPIVSLSTSISPADDHVPLSTPSIKILPATIILPTSGDRNVASSDEESLKSYLTQLTSKVTVEFSTEDLMDQVHTINNLDQNTGKTDQNQRSTTLAQEIHDTLHEMEVHKMLRKSSGHWACRKCGHTLCHFKELMHIPSKEALSTKVISLNLTSSISSSFESDSSSSTQSSLSDVKWKVQHFRNPKGEEFDVMMLGAADVANTRQSFPDATWFPPYSWRISICPICRSHLGWKYEHPDQPSNDVPAASAADDIESQAEFALKRVRKDLHGGFYPAKSFHGFIADKITMVPKENDEDEYEEEDGHFAVSASMPSTASNITQ